MRFGIKTGASYGQEESGEEFRVEFVECEGKFGCVFYSFDVEAVGGIMKRYQMGSIVSSQHLPQWFETGGLSWNSSCAKFTGLKKAQP